MYPSYCAVPILPVSMNWKRFSVRTGASEVIAAPVLLVGRLEQSPSDQTLLNLVD